MVNEEIVKELFGLAEPKYKNFMAGLLPTVPRETVIGVRVGSLRKLAKKIVAEGKCESFLSELPHRYYEENYIHAIIISGFEYDKCLSEIRRFLPYVDNWGVCDGLRPKCFSFNRKALIGELLSLLESEHLYTVRFAIEMLMLHFLGEDFKAEYLEAVARVKSEEYYLNMMISWYFATALAERYEETLPYLTEKRLSPWVHNKTISKAIESYRISPERKEYLRTLK